MLPRVTLRRAVAMTAVLVTGLVLSVRTSALPERDGTIGLFDGQGDVGVPKIAGSAPTTPSSQDTRSPRAA